MTKPFPRSPTSVVTRPRWQKIEVAEVISKSAGPKIVERVGCVTTPGETIDAVVTEAGVAVSPRRADLADRLVAAGIEVLSIEALRDRACALAPSTSSATASADARVVAVVEYRDGRITEVIRKVPGFYVMEPH